MDGWTDSRSAPDDHLPSDELGDSDRLVTFTEQAGAAAEVPFVGEMRWIRSGLGGRVAGPGIAKADRRGFGPTVELGELGLGTGQADP